MTCTDPTPDIEELLLELRDIVDRRIQTEMQLWQASGRPEPPRHLLTNQQLLMGRRIAIEAQKWSGNKSLTSSKTCFENGKHLAGAHFRPFADLLSSSASDRAHDHELRAAYLMHLVESDIWPSFHLPCEQCARPTSLWCDACEDSSNMVCSECSDQSRVCRDCSPDMQ